MFATRRLQLSAQRRNLSHLRRMPLLGRALQSAYSVFILLDLPRRLGTALLSGITRLLAGKARSIGVPDAAAQRLDLIPKIGSA